MLTHSWSARPPPPAHCSGEPVRTPNHPTACLRWGLGWSGGEGAGWGSNPNLLERRWTAADIGVQGWRGEGGGGGDNSNKFPNVRLVLGGVLEEFILRMYVQSTLFTFVFA